MKLQLTKDKTIELRLPWEKGSAGAVSSAGTGPADVVGVSFNSEDPRGYPAVRLQRKKDGLHLVAAGFVPAPSVVLPNSWDESRATTTWELPAAYQAPQAALAVQSSGMIIRQTTLEALIAAPTAEAKGAAAPARKKLGIRRDADAEKKTGDKAAEKSGPAKKIEPPTPYVPVSREGLRSVVAPLAEASFFLQTGLPEYQVIWLARILPEGKRPTVGSVQTAPAALLSALYSQPEFIAADGTAAAVFVTNSTIYFAGYHKGELVLFRECPGVAGYAALRELVKSGLGITDDLVESILEDTLIDPRPALDPLVRPVLQQLQISLDYLAQRHDVHVDKIFLMGLPAGAYYWSQFAQETLGMPFFSPGVFEGLQQPVKTDAIPADLTPSASQVFLAALGAARAAMEGGNA